RLRLPHGKVGGEGVAENEPRRARWALDLVVEGDAVCLDPHGVSFALHRPIEFDYCRIRFGRGGITCGPRFALVLRPRHPGTIETSSMPSAASREKRIR